MTSWICLLRGSIGWLTGRWERNNLIKTGNLAHYKHEGENYDTIKELAYFYEFAANINTQTFVSKFISVCKIYRFPFYVVVLQKQLRGRWVTHRIVICFTVAIKAKGKQLQINSKKEPFCIEELNEAWFLRILKDKSVFLVEFFV